MCFASLCFPPRYRMGLLYNKDMPQTDTDLEAPLRVSLTTFARTIMQALRSSLWVGMPGTVEKFEAARPPVGTAGAFPATVDVALDFKYIRRGKQTDVADGEQWKGPPEPGVEGDIWGEYPVLRSVPVHYPGHQHMSVRGAISAGEGGWVKFSQRSLDTWTGRGAGSVPAFLRFLEIADAIFEPGLRNGAALPPPVVPENSSQVGPEDGTAGLEISHGEFGTPRDVALNNALSRLDIAADGTVTISGPLASITMSPTGEVTVNGTSIKLGEAASEALIKGNAFKTFYEAHTHTAPPGGGATSPPLAPVPPTALSTKVSTA